MKRIVSFVLALAMVVSLAACGGGNTAAATMHLRRAQGMVTVSDGGGKDIPVLENLGLYSGYGVGTRSTSYAWIDLDDVKLVKLDQNSEIAIEKEGKALDIELKSGSLFFNVTQPLADDETMEIRASTMLVGIRGTCGWVEVLDSRHMNVYLLEGKVKCTAGESVTVKAGEVGRLDRRTETVTVEFFTQDDIPDFVRGELDGVPLDAIPETTEPSPTPTPTPEPDYHFTDRDGTEMMVPAGAFATRVVEFIPGDPWTSYEPAMDPESTLGAPDYTGDRYTAQGGLTLGAGGVLVLEFRAAIYDGEGLDIYVFEVGADVEDTRVEVSNDLITWYDVGVAKGKTAGVDLNGKVPEGSWFHYVRLTDLRSSITGDWPGADIDAVCGLNVRAISGG